MTLNRIMIDITKPLVSVIIPAFNAEGTVRDAINSVLSQTYKQIEIIVINDGSTDNTLKILREYGEQIRYITQNNKGPSAARNAGIKIAKGDFIAYQDADDVSMPERIEREVDYLLNNPNMSMVFTETKTISGDKISKCHSEFLLLQHNYIPCGSVMHKKDILDSVGWWNEQVDWDLWIRISEKFEIGYIKECLYEYRKRETGISSVRGRLKNRLIDLQMFKDRYKRKKEIWIAFKIKRIRIECKLLRIIRFKNKRFEVLFWSGFQIFSNMIEKVIYIIERGVKKWE
ncbi:Glycosyltransferase AglI [ANME-1 cluster archaeon GoMg2]|nr:Glycosyltransferase AglI [ANME-1 cluster archaeon GoMg2]